MSDPKPYETQDAKPRGVLIAGIVLLGVTALSIVAMAGLFALFEAEREPAMTAENPMSGFREGPKGPILQVDPPKELTTLRATTQDTLSGYGWVDRENGIVRIPVSRAMALIVERGTK